MLDRGFYGGVALTDNVATVRMTCLQRVADLVFLRVHARRMSVLLQRHGRPNLDAIASPQQCRGTRDGRIHGAMALPDNVTCPGVFCQYQVNCAGSVKVTTWNLLSFNVHEPSCAPHAARVRDGSSRSVQQVHDYWRSTGKPTWPGRARIALQSCNDCTNVTNRLDPRAACCTIAARISQYPKY